MADRFHRIIAVIAIELAIAGVMAVNILFMRTVPALIVSSCVLLFVMYSFFKFAIDMTIKVGDRTSASIYGFVFFHIISMILMFANICRWSGLNYPAGEDKRSILGSIYFSFVTWTTVGYGDITPRVNTRLVVAAEAFLGYIVMAFLISLLTAMIRRNNRDS